MGNDNGVGYSNDDEVQKLLAEVNRLRSLVRRMQDITADSVEYGPDGYYTMMMALTNEALSG